MRDNPELDSSLAIDYIQNRRHFTMIQVFILSSFFFLTMKKCVWLLACLSGAASDALTTVVLSDNASS